MENRVLLALQISLAQWLHPIESRKSCADQKTTSTAYSVINFNIYAVPACELEIISVTIGKRKAGVSKSLKIVLLIVFTGTTS